MKNKKDLQSVKEKSNNETKMTSSEEKSSVNGNSSHTSAIPTTVMNKTKMEWVETRHTHEHDADSYEMYGRNMYYMPSLNNNYCGNVLPANNNHFDYYNFNNDYIGQKGQYFTSAPLSDNMFNYYEVLEDLNNNTLMAPPNEQWASSMLNSPAITTGPEMTCL